MKVSATQLMTRSIDPVSWLEIIFPCSTNYFPSFTDTLHFLIFNLQITVWGTLPSSLADLTKLVTLDASANELSGEVPWQLCSRKQSSEELFSIAVDCDEVSCDCDCTCE